MIILIHAITMENICYVNIALNIAWNIVLNIILSHFYCLFVIISKYSLQNILCKIFDVNIHRKILNSEIDLFVCFSMYNGYVFAMIIKIAISYESVKISCAFLFV